VTATVIIHTCSGYEHDDAQHTTVVAFSRSH
jgi:hypothetical protein